LTGAKLSVFYINSDDQKLIEDFNNTLLEYFDVSRKKRPPLIFLFKYSNEEISDRKIVELTSGNKLIVYEELKDILTTYIKDSEGLFTKYKDKVFSVAGKIA